MAHTSKFQPSNHMVGLSGMTTATCELIALCGGLVRNTGHFAMSLFVSFSIFLTILWLIHLCISSA